MSNIVKISKGKFAGDEELILKREELKNKLLSKDKDGFSVNEFGEIMRQNATAEYTDIKYVIKKILKKHAHWGIISINNYYVQFMLPGSSDTERLKNRNQQLYLEAVSDMYLPELGNKDYEFKKLGFTINRGVPVEENYHKCFSLSEYSIDQIIQEIVIIFETIYNVKIDSYEIEEGEPQTAEYIQYLEQIDNNGQQVV
jgi:hypothetical protein